MNDIIEGFDWYLPIAFKDCISQCKFARGYIIYRNKLVGANWGEEKINIDFCIQIKSSGGVVSSAEDLDAFNLNWDSKIVFEKIYPNNIKYNTIVETTQGRLFSFLWKNDEKYLNEKGQLLPVITSTYLSPKNINASFFKQRVPDMWSGFAMIMDSVNNLIISKRNSIIEALGKSFDFNIMSFPGNESLSINVQDMKSFSGISPTLGVELFLINSNDSEKIQEILKQTLFKGQKNRFNINSHGLFILK